MQIPQVYLLAGLGFDKRIFSNLNILNANINYLEWLEPEPNECMENYICRMTDQIDNTKKPIVLIGHSFGGIIIQNISKLIEINKVIIISSIKSKDEMPGTLKFFKILPLYKLFTKELILKSFPLWARAFGYNSEKGRNLFVQMISNCSDNYFKWAMDKIVHFEGIKLSTKIFHIHGSRDKTFPIGRIKNPIPIEDGSHFMVFSKGEEISEVINKELI